jgi:Domain of unknown function (DUF1906)
MRRAIVAAVTGGLVLAGALGTPAFASVHNAGKTAKKPTVTAKAKKAASTKTVVYRGYEFQVPASWPVHRLDEYPRTCVRYDIHAVYLGTPGPSMQCPAGLIGRTETVSFIPGQETQSGAGAGTAAQPDGSGTEIERLSAVHSAITQDATEGELRVALGDSSSAATVSGTYAADPMVVKQALSTLRVAPAGAKDTPQSASASAGSQSSASRSAALLGQSSSAVAAAAAPKAAPSPTYSSWMGVPSHWPVQIVQTPKAKPTVTPPATPPVVKTPSAPVSGFDTCTAPSVKTMGAWRRDYAAVGIYLGGADAACAHGNLSASWVTSVAALGYGMLPTYVGRQAPCWDGGGLAISPASAATEGESAGADAVNQAKALGLAEGSPIYYDMEAYKGSASCTTAVLTFLGSWNRRVTAAGYVTGMYSSALSGIQDVQSAATARTPGFTVPDAVWVALWDGKPSLALGDTAWSQANMNKQYEGNVNQAVGGIKLNIDKDIVGGPVAR